MTTCQYCERLVTLDAVVTAQHGGWICAGRAECERFADAKTARLELAAAEEEIERLKRLNEELINKLAAASEVIGRRAYREDKRGNSDTAENP